jgi:hypothetical protein
MRTDDLHEVLERAAAPVERPDLAGAALARAHRVRVRRHGIAAGGAAVAVVAAVVVGTSLTGAPSGRQPAPTGPPEGPPGAQTEAIPASVVQDFWDVPGVAELPLRDSVLPEQLEQPASAPALAGAPVPAAAVSLWGEGDTTYLLSPDGEWRTVPHPGPEPWLAELSDDGTRLAMPGPDGLEVWDVAAGTSTVLPWPADARLPVADLVVRLRWDPDGEHVLLIGPRGSWVLGLDGTVEERPYPVNRYGEDVYFDDDGRVVELATLPRQAGREVVVWDGSERVSRVDATPLESLDRAAVRGDLVAAVRGDGGWYSPREPSDWDGLVVFGRDDVTARAYLPIRDGASTYSDNGYLTVHGWLDDETVLAWVQPRVGQQEVGEEWYLVAWHYPSGELTRLSGGDGYARLTDVVPSLLGR